MNRVLPVATMLLLSACAPQVAKFDMPGPDRSVSVSIKDLRPDIEKKDETFSRLITSSGYGISRKGDQGLDPPMNQVFRRRAFEKLGAHVTRDIAIYHMVVYMNAKSELRKVALSAGVGGIVGVAIVSGMASNVGVNMSQSTVDRNTFESVDHEYERAYYTEVENPNRASVYVIYIDASINGRRLFVRTIAPNKAPEGKNAYTLAVDSAIQYYLAQYEAARALAVTGTGDNGAQRRQ